jgi:hypothetical protein
MEEETPVHLLMMSCLVVALLAPSIAVAGTPAPSGGLPAPQLAPSAGAWPQSFTLAPGGQAVFGISVGAPGPLQVGANWSGPPLAFALRDPSGRVQKQATGQRPPSVRLDHAAHTAGVWSLVVANPGPPQGQAPPPGSTTAQGQVGANFPYANLGGPPASPPPPSSLAGSGQQAAQPAVAPLASGPSPCDMAGNCPPQGSITITAPRTGTVWPTNSYQVIHWTCNGTRSNIADVTLWQNNRQVKVADVWLGSPTGKTAYIVPTSAPPGNYELRVALQGDPRVQAWVPVTIIRTAVTLAVPQEPLIVGAPHTITWTYTGSVPTLKLSVLDASGAVVESVPSIAPGSDGKGSWRWNAPAMLPAGKTSAEYRFQVSGIFHKDVTNNAAMAEVVLGTSNPFTVRLPKIQVGASFLADAGVRECSVGRQYVVPWTSELNGKPVKAELYKDAKLLQTIAATLPSGPANTLAWTVPSLPETLTQNMLTIRVTSLDFPAVKGETSFSCQKPAIVLISPDPNQNLAMKQTYQIGWYYFGDPGPHVRVDLLSAKANGSDMAVFETPAQSAPLRTSGGPLGAGQISWTLTNKGPHVNFYIQVRSVETQTVSDLKRYYIAYTGGTGVTTVTTGSSSSSSGTGSTSSSSSSGSTSSGTSSSGSSSGAGSAFPSNCSGGLQSGKMQLSGATSLKYNPSDSATFRSSSFATLDSNCYAVMGLLGSDQQLKYRAASSASAAFRYGSPIYFSNGYVQQGQLWGDQTVEYGPSRTVKLHASSVPKFAGGYLQAGQLVGDQALQCRSGHSPIYVRGSSVAYFANGYVKTGLLTSNTTLEYRAGTSTWFRGFVTFGADGYVQSGQLAGEPTLEYAPGKSAYFKFRAEFRTGGYVKSGFLAYQTTLETAGGSETVPAYAYVAFDNAGRMVSFNPPSFSACYKCDPAQDHDCSGGGGLPPCE